jgi:UDP-N-acetyl-D-glucosamine dehydrogenase
LAFDTNLKDKILGRISNKTAVIGIVGLGYVGLPLALRFVDAGFNVLGLDVDEEKVSKLLNGQTYIEHIGASQIVAAVSGNRRTYHLRADATKSTPRA